MRQSERTFESAGHPSRHVRRGMTMLELIIVMVIIGTLSGVFWKSMKETFDESSRRAASREVASYLIRARAAAVQRSRQSWFVRSGNTIKIITDSSGVKVPYGLPLNMLANHSVTLTSSKDSISFDPRGFTTLIVPSPRFIVSAGAGKDTICVTGLGTISTRKCT